MSSRVQDGAGPETPVSQESHFCQTNLVKRRSRRQGAPLKAAKVRRHPRAARPQVSRCYTRISMPRVRFAPSPTGFLHIGSARTYIFNWLYARPTGGTMILRIDDTDVGRNTDASLNSIFEGLRWLDLGWDEEYKQSERVALHRQIADAIFQKGLAYRDFTPA